MFNYTELFYSLQGEGERAGVPSVFLRLFGCNLRCPGFYGKQKVDSIDPSQYSKFEDLPLMDGGCDTYASIYPQFSKFAQKITVEELVKKLSSFDCRDLVITGGEPLLPGNQRRLVELLTNFEFSSLPFDVITFETNGTQELIPEMVKAVEDTGFTYLFSVSPKLSNSGETEEARKVRLQLDFKQEPECSNTQYLKFVIATRKDAEEALQLAMELGAPPLSIYFMPMGGIVSTYELHKTAVANLALEYGVRYSDRLQVPLFKNDWGT